VLKLGSESLKSLKIRGRGVIVASEGIQIFSGISKESLGDLCILMSKSGIEIQTEAPIQAGLIAFSSDKKGYVKWNRKVKIFGNLLVDRLFTLNWPTDVGRPFENVLDYDPSFSSSDETHDIFAISIGPWVTFRRLTEGS